MRKKFYVFIAVVVFGCGLTACNRQGNALLPEETEQHVEEQAYESDDVISKEDQGSIEVSRREETEQKYAMYKEFGLTYDKEQDRFFYDKKMVRYFKDDVNEENTNGFFYEDGVIDLNVVRDANGTLVGLNIASDEEFLERTSKQSMLKEEMSTGNGTEEAKAYEIGDLTAEDHSLDKYTEFGISYDTANDKWMYQNQQIHFFYDADGSTYIDYSVLNGLNLKVV